MRADGPVRALIAAWLLAVVGGWYFVERYEYSINAPLPHGAVAHWPADSALRLAENGPTLVFFLHPKCPCSRASLHELNRLLTATANGKSPAPELLVVTTVPATADDTWWDTGTVAQSGEIVQAKLFIDRAGTEAARFGATTSGTVMFFDESGNRRYAGGITVARGHEGQSAGADSVTALLRGEAVEMSEMPVFGCRLCLPQPEGDVEIASTNQPGTVQAKSSN